MIVKYKVSTTCYFGAENPEGALRQMIAYLQEYYDKAEYRIEWEDLVPVSNEHSDYRHFSIYLDAEDVLTNKWFPEEL